MRKAFIFALAFLSVLGFSYSVANAGEVKFQYDYVNGKHDGQQLKAEYNDTIFSMVSYGFELNTKQNFDNHEVGSQIVAKTGLKIGFFGITFSPRVEIGHAFKSLDSGEFYGGEVRLTVPSGYDPVSVTTGVRYRDGINIQNMKTIRTEFTTEYSLNKSSRVGVSYYHTELKDKSNTVGVYYRVKF